MRRLARQLFTLFSAVSLVLCVLVLLARTTWVGYLEWGHGQFPNGVTALGFRERQALVIYRQSPVQTVPAGTLSTAMHADVYTPFYGYGSAAFVWPLPNGRSEGFIMRTWFVPLWKLAILTAVLPALWLAARLAVCRRRRCETRGHAGLCPSCGYDLRASPERCPECGADMASGASMHPHG